MTLQQFYSNGGYTSKWFQNLSKQNQDDIILMERECIKCIVSFHQISEETWKYVNIIDLSFMYDKVKNNCKVLDWDQIEKCHSLFQTGKKIM